ncbi:hypothetical protein [Candidatus Ichthyocystis sparus]|uniref:hypothetical protein n=1 Tax=Candidatus Ichthyocystis sparus TaxID=1561004 RepID=UPI000B81F56F|nr:hypothetical protein [Candidatus Ichthyocystis sparus]
MRPYTLINDFTAGKINENDNVKNEAHDLVFCTRDTLCQDNSYEEKLLLPDIFKLTKSDESNFSSENYNFNTYQQHTYSTLKRRFIEDSSPSIEPRPKVICLKQITSNEKNYIASLAFTEKITTSPNLKNIGRKIKDHSGEYKTTAWPIIKKDLRIKLYRCDTRQSMCTEKIFNTSSLDPTQQITAVNTSVKNNQLSVAKELKPKRTNLKIGMSDKNIIKKNISLKTYARSRLLHTKNNSRIVYMDAIKKIDIDNNGLFKNSVLEKIDEIIERKGLLKLSIDLSPTYSNIRKYALEKISSLLNDDIVNSDILITPEMSISDLRLSCISNKVFFEKLREHCEKIAKDILATPDNYLSHIFQSYASFNSKDPSNTNSIRIKLPHKKNKFLPKLKELIADTISNLPNRIIYELERIDQETIVNALFSDVHGVLVSKSLIKSLNLRFKSNKNKFKFANERFDDNLSFLNKLLEKIGNLVRKFCIFHEGVFLPSESTVKQLSKYILSDIYDVHPKFHKKLKFPARNISKPRESTNNVNLEHRYKKGVKTNTLVKEELQIKKLDPLSRTDTTLSILADIKTKKIEIGNSDPIATTSITENPLEQQTMTKEFSLKSYCRSNLLSADNTSSIYKDITKNIGIDNNCRFKNCVLEELSACVTSRGFTKSSINIDATYLNVRKYIWDKISPCISDDITTTDVLITPGISLSDLLHNCVSNKVFFEKLNKNCEEIAKNIYFIPDHYFLSIIQTCIYLGSPKHIQIPYTKKNKLCSELKLLIMETISNLPNNIIHELKKFKTNDVINGLFVNIHDVYLQKSLIRKIELIFNSNKLPDDKFISNLNLLNNLLTKIFIEVESHPVLHEGKIFFPGEHTSKLLSKYLLSDMYGVPIKIYKNLTIQKHLGNAALDNSYTKNARANTPDNIKIRSSEKSILIPQRISPWNPNIVTSTNMYKLAISMSNINRSNFENCVAEKIKHYPIIKECLSKKNKIYIDLSVTHDRIKNYILETFVPFLKEIEEETKIRIKLIHGMTIDELRLAYISNEEFFDKLRKFCTKVVSGIKSCNNNTLVDLIQSRVPLKIYIMQSSTPLETKILRINKKRRAEFHDEISNLLIRNISNISEEILTWIKLIPHPKLIEGFFSPFHDVYVDNTSLLKVKSVFDTVQKKLKNDHLLIGLVDQISIDIMGKIGKIKTLRMLINRHIISEKLSIHNYIKKLVKEETHTLKDKLSDPIMIIRNDKIETAATKTKDEIFNLIELDLIETTIRSYNKLCLKAYRSHKSKV